MPVRVADDVDGQPMPAQYGAQPQLPGAEHDDDVSVHGLPRVLHGADEQGFAAATEQLLRTPEAARGAGREQHGGQ